MIKSNSWADLGEKDSLKVNPVYIAWFPPGTWRECKLLYARKDSIQVQTPTGGIMDVNILEAIRI